jgi:hypothetical protein
MRLEDALLGKRFDLGRRIAEQALEDEAAAQSEAGRHRRHVDRRDRYRGPSCWRIAGAGLDVYVVEHNYRVVYGDTLEDIEAFLDARVVRPLNTL